MYDPVSGGATSSRERIASDDAGGGSPKSPREKSPRAKSPRLRLQSEKSPREKSPRAKSPQARLHSDKSPEEKSPRAKSPRARLQSEKSPRSKARERAGDKSPKASPRTVLDDAELKISHAPRGKPSRQDRSPRHGSAPRIKGPGRDDSALPSGLEHSSPSRPLPSERPRRDDVTAVDLSPLRQGIPKPMATLQPGGDDAQRLSEFDQNFCRSQETIVSIAPMDIETEIMPDSDIELGSTQHVGQATLMPPEPTAAEALRERPTLVTDDGARADRQKILYKVWPGQNAFFCSGRCITAKETEPFSFVEAVCDLASLCCHCACTEDFAPSVEYTDDPKNFSSAHICAWCVILVPSLFFFVFGFSGLWLSAGDSVFGKLVCILVTLLFLSSVTFLVLASYTDPGIVPRREVIIASNLREEMKQKLGFDVLGDGIAVGHSTVTAEMRKQGYSWCNTCRIIRPPRSSHCPNCDNCVLRFDHHCPFINNCVGHRNYLFFVGFTSSVILLAITVISGFIYGASNGYGQILTGQEVGSIIFLSIMLMVVAICAALVFVLWGYHVFLIYTGQTTREHWRAKHGEQKTRTLTERRAPRLFNPQAVVDGETVSNVVRV